nr:MAG TPA: hypothetical protein [Bacteriophage sp.]
MYLGRKWSFNPHLIRFQHFPVQKKQKQTACRLS